MMQTTMRPEFNSNKEGCLAHASMRVCVVRSQGVIAPYIMDAYSRAFRGLKAKIRIFDVAAPEAAQGQMQERLHALVAWRPTLAVCYGYTGLALSGYFRSAGIPLVLLFYDSPFGLPWNQYQECMKELLAAPDLYYCFVWDRAYLEALQKLGVRHVFPIMLAADTSIFRPRNPAYRFDVSFAGRMGNLDDLRGLRRRAANPRTNEFAEKLIDRKIASPAAPLQKLWADLARESFPELALDWSRPGMGELHLHIHREGSIRMRQAMLGSIHSAKIDLFGVDWNLPGATIHGGVDYVHDLPALYADSRINVNITAPQLEYSVNNRIFDVGAAGGFLLTDYREDLQQIFSGFDKIAYGNGEELDSKVAYFLAHESERLELAAALQKEIVEHHTYGHRALQILQSMTETA